MQPRDGRRFRLCHSRVNRPKNECRSLPPCPCFAVVCGGGGWCAHFRVVPHRKLGCSWAARGHPRKREPPLTRATLVVLFETTTVGEAGRGGAAKYAQQPPVMSLFSGRCSVSPFRTHCRLLGRPKNLWRHRHPSLRPMRPCSRRLLRPLLRWLQLERRRPLARASLVTGLFLATSPF